MPKRTKSDTPVGPSLRVSHIWRDELMSDTVFGPEESIVLGGTDRSNVIVPAVGLPENFEMFRPGTRGYIMTLGAQMAGEVHLNNVKQSVQDFVGSRDAFHAETIAEGDHGLIHLDASGEHKLFFQFISAEVPLPLSPVIRDLDMLLPAYAFAVALIGCFMIYALAIHGYDEGRFSFPGNQELVADYILSRPAPPPPPAEEVKAGDDEGVEKAKPASSNGASGKSGGEGKKKRKRAENPEEGEPDEVVPEEIQIGLNSNESRQVFDKIRNRGGFDKKMGAALARLQGVTNDGSAKGYGKGKGTGIGPGAGTGTLTKGTGKGPGGGGSAHADVRTQRKLNTGGKRAAKGTPGGDSVKEVAVKLKTGTASGSLGGLTNAQIEKVLKTRFRSITTCYRKELQRNKGLGGKVVVGWTIDNSGKVKRAKIRQTTIRNNKIEDCIIRQISALKFPSPNGSAKVTYPFIFGQS